MKAMVTIGKFYSFLLLLSVTDEVDAEAEEVLNELNSLSDNDDSNLGENNRAQDGE
jgi:hypothetical protein